MNIENIKVGNRYKNYNELCVALGIKPKVNGNSKKAQVQEIERFIKYDKDRFIFIITEIYETPLEKVENKRNLPPYIQYMETLLLQYLQQEKTGKISVSNSKLAENLQMIHSDFSEYYNKKYELANILNVDIFCVHEFMSMTNSAYKKAIKTVLNRLESRSIILYDTRWKTVRREKEIEDNGKVKERLIIDFASEYEKQQLLKIRYDTLKKYGGNLQKVYTEGKANEYFNELNDKLYMIMGIENAYKVYDISINQDAIENEYYKSLSKLTDNADTSHLRTLVNDMWSNKNLERIENKVLTAKEIETSNNSLEYITKSQRERLNGNYMSHMKTLNSALIVDGIRK